ncbi:MAG: hypothetical protein ACRDJW_02300 [Thermomicrobiales bacterium]
MHKRTPTCSILFATAVLLAVAAAGAPAARANQAGSLDSGALGLTRAEIEAQWGPGEQVDVPGHPIYDEMYAYAGQSEIYYAWFVVANGEDVARYVEVAWGEEGIPSQDARALAEGLLPADAEYTETYIAPPTPRGAIALETHRYVSESLGGAYGGAVPAEILVIYHERWDDAAETGSRVTAVSIMSRMITQQG